MSSNSNKRFGRVLVATSAPLHASADRGNKKTTSQKVADLHHLVLPENPSLAPSTVKDDSHLHGPSAHDVSTLETLDIDDIDLDDEDPPTNTTTTLKKHNLLHKLKPNMKGVKKLQKVALNLQKGGNVSKGEEGPDKLPQNRSKGQILAAYGFDQAMTGTVAGLQDRLKDRQDKMRAMEVRTTEMQDAAQTFRKQADEILKSAQAKHKQKLF